MSSDTLKMEERTQAESEVTVPEIVRKPEAAGSGDGGLLGSEGLPAESPLLVAPGSADASAKKSSGVFLERYDQSLPRYHDFMSPEELYHVLEKNVLKYHPSSDLTMIRKAYELAAESHKDQKRKSGEPYIIHPLCVAIILAELELDKETIASGLLHDVVEDTQVTNEDIRREFGSEVELLVDGVTKLGEIKYTLDKVEVQAENLRKMFLAMAKDIRVILIKLADRLHNLRTLQYMRPAKQQEKARETLDIYSPIAQRLGISRIKTEMDDLALRYLEPEVYFDLVHQVDMRKTQRQAFVEGIVNEVKEQLAREGIQAEVKGRVKHFFSIYKKMVNQDKTIDQIYDLFAIRIMVNTVTECYASLGIIHKMYRPVPGRFKDYIAMAKQNGYQSLHNTMIGPEGTPFEIQIRTFEMHRIAEYGIAAHWKYKEASSGHRISGNQEEEKLAWLRQILEWQQNMSDNKEFVSIIKQDLDLFTENVYCFTPEGDVKELPNGSNAIDFAYSVHSAVGNRMVSCRINGKLCPIDTVLKNGDRVEIITSQNSRGPSRDWLKTVKSSQARNKINQWFRQELKTDNIERGKELLTNAARQKGYTPSDLLRPAYMAGVFRKYGFRDWDSVLAAIGHGGLKEGQVINKMISLYEEDRRKQITDEEILSANAGSRERILLAPRDKGGVVVLGLEGIAVHFAKCCSPIPGDEIVGFVTRGRGVTIHRNDCVNVLHMSEDDRSRLVEVEWMLPDGSRNRDAYPVEITVYATNRTGLIVDVSKVFAERKIDILHLSTRTSRNGTASLEITFSVRSHEELSMMVREIRKVRDVIDVERKNG